MGDRADGEDHWGITAGRIWLMQDGREPADITEVREFKAEDFSSGHGLGLDGGLEGGLSGELDGALQEVGSRSYTIEFQLSEGKSNDVLAALLMGMSLEEYRDLVQWVREARWLRAVTGLNWGSFE